MATKTSKSGKQTKSKSVKKAAPAAKPVAVKAKVKARPVTKPVAFQPVTAKTTTGHFTPEQRHHMIADAAFYLALRRGAGSDPFKNWLDAEKEIDGRIGWPPPKR